MVELCQVPEHARQSGVVSPTAHQPHGKDSVAGHGGIAVVRELAQGIEDGELRV